MKKILLFSFFLVDFFLFSQADSLKSFKFTQSPQFDFIESLNLQSGEVSNELKDIIANHDSSRFICTQGDDLKNFMIEELIPSFYLPEHLEFHFLSMDKISDTNFLIQVLNKIDFSSWGEEYKNSFCINYIYNANVIKHKGKWVLDVSLQDQDYVKKKFSYGIYFHDNNFSLSSNFKKRKVKKFVNPILKEYSLKEPTSELKYVISNRTDAFKIFGFVYSISATGMYFNKMNLLLSVKSDDIDKHELTHFLFRNFKLKKFLSEGIAVYEGGSNSMRFNEFLFETLNNEFMSLAQHEQQDWILQFLDNRLNGGPYMTFFYACSGLLIDKYIKEFGKENLSKIFRENPEITPDDFITKYLNENKKNNEIYLLNCINSFINEEKSIQKTTSK